MIRAYAAWLGYKIRPYDQMADARRWFWQRPTPCGFSGTIPAEIMAEFREHIRLWEKWQQGPRCERVPEGGWCSREPGHDGPCAARKKPTVRNRPAGVQRPGSETQP